MGKPTDDVCLLHRGSLSQFVLSIEKKCLMVSSKLLLFIVLFTALFLSTMSGAERRRYGGDYEEVDATGYDQLSNSDIIKALAERGIRVDESASRRELLQAMVRAEDEEGRKVVGGTGRSGRGHVLKALLCVG